MFLCIFEQFCVNFLNSAAETGPEVGIFALDRSLNPAVRLMAADSMQHLVQHVSAGQTGESHLCALERTACLDRS